MSEVTVFLAAFLGSFLGMLTAVIPVIYYIKEKLSKSPMGAMFG